MTMTMGSVLQLVLVLVNVQFFFALNALISGEAVRTADPIIFSFLRDAGGSAVLLAAAHASPEGIMWPRPKDWWIFGAIGVGGVYFGQLFLLIAMTYITPFNAMVLDALIPVFTLGLGHVFSVDRIDFSAPQHLAKVAAIVLAVTGAVVVVSAQAQQAAALQEGGGGGGGGGGGAETGGVGGGDEGAGRAAFEAAAASSSEAAAAAAVAAPPPGLMSDFTVGNLFGLAFALGGSTYPLLQKRVMVATRMPPLSVAAFG